MNTSPATPADGGPSVHRLPFPMRTVFQDLLLVTYAVPPEKLAAQLPPAIHPWIHRGRSYVSIVVGNIRGMRPAGLPEFLGVNYYQVVYRAVVRLQSRDGGQRRGVFFLRSDGNDPLMSYFGNRLTEFRFHDFHTGAIGLFRRGRELLVSVETPDGRGDLVLMARDFGPAERHPPAPGFASAAEEKRELVELFHAYAHDQSKGCVYDLPIKRGQWHMNRLEPVDGFSAFFTEGPWGTADAQPVCPAMPVSLVAIRECQYLWKPMAVIPAETLVQRGSC